MSGKEDGGQRRAPPRGHATPAGYTVARLSDELAVNDEELTGDALARIARPSKRRPRPPRDRRTRACDRRAVAASYPIRPARVDDVPALAGVERAAATMFGPYGLAELFSETSEVAKLEAAARDGRLWVATSFDGTVVGFALAAVVGGVAHLDELDVHPDHGRRGVGRALIDTVIRWARAHGHRALTLNTMRDVPWNAPYYERLGFVILSDDALPPALAELRRLEVEHGLPGERRVSMRRALD